MVFTFVRSNLNRLSAMLVYFGHAMTDLRRANENTCLLGRVEAFLRATDVLLEGCYAVYDPIESVWIRSGKAVGSASSSPRAGLLNRWEGKSGHRATAGKITADETNKFALCYPTRSNPINLPSTRRGYFDDLELYVGLGFNRDSETAGLTSTDADGGNIFFWSKEVLELLDKSKEGSCTTLKEKQLVMVGYLFELLYDLCLSPLWNVSQNPGFESRLGVFNNSKVL